MINLNNRIGGEVKYKFGGRVVWTFNIGRNSNGITLIFWFLRLILILEKKG